MTLPRARHRLLVGTVAALAALGVVVAAGNGPAAAAQSSAARPRPAQKPNIVFVLTDDLSHNLVQYMPHVRQMMREGESFDRYVVTDSLCCPSRSSIFTGRFPHNTGVFTNNPPDGGFATFNQKGDQYQTFATALKARGYRTAMMGKYLNGYQARGGKPGEPGYELPTPMPPGWTSWAVTDNGYQQYNYTLNLDGRALAPHFGRTPRNYLTDVLSDKGAGFITRSARAHKPFMLELATSLRTRR